MVRGEEQPIIANAPPEYALPLLTLEGFYVAVKRIRGHLCEYASHPLLNGFREDAEVLLSGSTELKDPVHVLFRPTAVFFPGASV